MTPEDDKDMDDFNFKVDEILQNTPYGDQSYVARGLSDSDSGDDDIEKEKAHFGYSHNPNHSRPRNVYIYYILSMPIRGFIK